MRDGQATQGLAIKAVSHRYGSRLAVDDVSLSVAPGEILCLLGPSGCGKSTTLRLVAGLEDLQQGEVWIRGRLVAGPNVNLPTEIRRVGMVFQDHALFPHVTVAENIGFGLPAAQRLAAGRRWAERLGLGAHADHYPHSLSGGEQQRVALARALAPEPAVMLLDEPFSSLDGRLRDQIRDETVALLKQAGTPTLLVTHEPEEAMRMGDRIALMHQGRLEQVDTPVNVYGRPASPFAARFLSECNELSGPVRAGAVDTPWGRLPAPGVAEGETALLLFRPEVLREAEPGQGAPAFKVKAARSLGPARRLEVALDGAGAGMGPDGALIARLPPGRLPEIGESVALALAADACFVFPAR